MSTTARKARKQAGTPFTHKNAAAPRLRDVPGPRNVRRRRRSQRLELRRLFQTPQYLIRPTALAHVGLDDVPGRSAREWFAEAAPRLYRLVRGADGSVTSIRTDYQHRVVEQDRGRPYIR